MSIPQEGHDKRAEEVKLLARDHAELAIETLAEVARDPGAKDAARVLASKVLLDRGFGAPERRVEQKVDVNIYDQRAAHLSALQKLAERNAPVQIEDHSRIRETAEDADWETTPPRR